MSQHGDDRGLTELEVALVAARLRGEASCAGCAYLYAKDHGYSSYTVMGTNVHCALDLNKALLPKDGQSPYDVDCPDDFLRDYQAGIADGWAATKNARCEHFVARLDEEVKHIPRLSVEWNNSAEDRDETRAEMEAIPHSERAAIIAHATRK